MSTYKSENTNKNVFWNKIEKTEDAIISIEYAIAIISFFVMFVAIIIGIVMRFFLKIPNQYGEEISRYSMICGIFFGVSIGVNKGAHLNVDGVVSKLPAKAAKVVAVFAEIVTMGTYWLLFVLAIKFADEMRGFGQTSPAMKLPMYIVYSIIAAGLLMSSLHSVLVLIKNLRSKPALENGER